MSTIRTNNITDAASGNAMTVADLNQGRAKAWVNFNGTGTIAARDSFNLASLVDNGLGDYSQNVTAAFANANYCFTYSFGGTAAIGAGRTLEDIAARTTALTRFAVFNTSFANADAAVISADAKGDV